MSAPDIRTVSAERDLYLRLLTLGTQDALAPFLSEALSYIAEASGAKQGYLELTDEAGDPDARTFRMAIDCTDDEIESFRQTISTGIIGEAIERGETVSTAAAVSDPRFGDLPSVAANAIRAVLCAPIGSPAFGVLYLQGRKELGPFSEGDRQLAEIFARHLAPFAGRLLHQERNRTAADPTRRWRDELDLEGIIGVSTALADIFRVVAIAAPADIPILITGASGTGKSQLASAIHRNSRRRAGAFVHLNCGAIPESLVESELFGAMPGSFTGATRRLRGKVEAADRGTLFLDEVGELPLAAQVKLLTLLQSGEYYPVGSERPMRVDLRIIAATNRDVEAAVEARTFREDLYHRLNVVHLRMADLSERPDDIVPLARCFRDRATQRGTRPLPFSVAARRHLRNAEWPGNVRELSNRIEWAVLQATAEAVSQIEPAHLVPPTQAAPPSDEGPKTWTEATRRFQKQLLVETLEGVGGNRSEASRRLKLSRTRLYELLAAFEITS